jgi:hypothetical protein
MITPEFVREQYGEFIFVANHNVMTSDNVARSIDYNRARILNARTHLPAVLSHCRLIYDVRGQSPTKSVLALIEGSLSDICRVEFKR